MSTKLILHFANSHASAQHIASMHRHHTVVASSDHVRSVLPAAVAVLPAAAAGHAGYWVAKTTCSLTVLASSGHFRSVLPAAAAVLPAADQEGE